jgi:hypothetical protein
VNVLVPGGPTDTPMISDQAGWPREKMLRPEIMGPPILWLVSDDPTGFNRQRITAARWDASLPPAEAAKRASRHRVAGGAIGRRDMADGQGTMIWVGSRPPLEAVQRRCGYQSEGSGAPMRPG